jgi:hypothetical protein
MIEILLKKSTRIVGHFMSKEEVIRIIYKWFIMILMKTECVCSFFWLSSCIVPRISITTPVTAIVKTPMILIKSHSGSHYLHWNASILFQPGIHEEQRAP